VAFYLAVASAAGVDLFIVLDARGPALEMLLLTSAVGLALSLPLWRMAFADEEPMSRLIRLLLAVLATTWPITIPSGYGLFVMGSAYFKAVFN
jgi:hypothetical protein